MVRIRKVTPGTYQLLISLNEPAIIAVGKLGGIGFPAGYYIYTGSALCGVHQRIARHARREKKIRWHIDYLLEKSAPIGYSIRVGNEKIECDANIATAQRHGARVVAKGFGSSDCKCESHLVYFESAPASSVFGEWQDVVGDGR